MKSVIDCVLNAFIRGLPDDVSIFVDIRNPKDLSETFKHALHVDERKNIQRELGTPHHPIMSHGPEHMRLSIHAHLAPLQNKLTVRRGKNIREVKFKKKYMRRCDKSLNPTRASQVGLLSGEFCRVL